MLLLVPQFASPNVYYHMQDLLLCVFQSQRYARLMPGVPWSVMQRDHEIGEKVVKMPEKLKLSIFPIRILKILKFFHYTFP
jgi:hypothetical protein